MAAVESLGASDPGREPVVRPASAGVPEQAGEPSGVAQLSWPSDASVLDALDAAVIVSDLAGMVLYANPAAELLYGYPRSALLGSNLREVLVGNSDLGAADAIMSQVLSGESWSGEFDVPHADGGIRTVRITDSPVFKNGVVVAVVGVAEDVTGSRQHRLDADRYGLRLRQLAEATAALAGAQDVKSAVNAVVQQAASAVGAVVSSVSLLTEGDVLVLDALHGATPDPEHRWDTYKLNAVLPASEAARTGQPVLVANPDEMAERYPALAGVIPEERSTVCLPLMALQRCLGVLTLSFAAARVPDEPEMTFLTALAGICAQTLERLAALEQARQSADKLEFLADASVELAGSLELDLTLSNVARLVVPRLADWCVVHVADGGSYRPVAVAHANPAKVSWARSLQDRYPVDPNSATGVPLVVATGRSELYNDISDDLLVAGAVDEEHLRILRELGMRSAVVVPLTGRTGSFGAITMIAAESRRRFNEADLQLAEDLARRAALAVETADAFRDQSRQLTAISRVAEAAQQAILAPLPQRVGPVLLAARYISAFADAHVGGDLYEVVARGDAVRLIVGDVRGKGLAAVRTTTVVLGEFRAAAAEHDDLATVAAQIDRRLTPYLGDEDFVTAVLAQIDADGTLTIANCGHPPIVLSTRGGQLREISGNQSLPLGLGARPADVTTNLQDGDRVLLYTDGLLEARDPSGKFISITKLVCDLATGSPESALDEILAKLHLATGHELTDDLALLVAQYSPLL
jgi:PAS domain S-box-containing protein